MLKKIPTIVAMIIIALGSYRLGQGGAVTASDAPLDFSAAKQVWDVVSKNYLHSGSIDTESLKYGLAKGLVESLEDQHSTYMDPTEAKAFMSSLNGELQGIGAELKLVNDMITVITPLPNSPAEKAGIRPGDIILKIDGVGVREVESLIDVVMKIRGPKGTLITLTVLHEDEQQPVDIEIIRDEIHTVAVSWSEKEIDGQKIAYVRLASFTEAIGEEFDQIIAEVVQGGYTRMVLDLRYNGGGYLDGAVEVLSHFIDADQPVVFIKNLDDEVIRKAIKKTINFRGSIAVLVNDASASASEIVAAALRDYGLANIIGVQTYGKGSVQEVHPFPDESMIRITIAEWLTAKRNSIESIGIEPDQILEQDFDAFKDGTDNQLNAALDYLSSANPEL